MQVLEKIKTLALPERQFVVIGSSSLEVLGLIDDASDVDIAVTHELYDSLKLSGWHEIIEDTGKSILQHEDFEAGVGFGDWSHDELMADAFFMDGIAFVSPHKLLAWKRSKNRPKDARHIELLEDYLTK